MAILDQSQTNYTLLKPGYPDGFGSSVFPLFAQSFVPSATAQIHSIEVALAKRGAVSTSIQMKVYSSSGGDPNVSIATANESLSTASVQDADTGIGYSLHTFTFTAGPTLTNGITYWIVLNTTSEPDTGAGDSVYVMGTAGSNDYYTLGLAKTYDGAVWAESAGDGGFDFGFSEYYQLPNSQSPSASISPSSSVSLSESLSLSPSSSSSLSPSLSPSLSVSPSATPSASPSRSEYDDLYDLKSTSYTPKYTNWGPGNNMAGSGHED